jgi:Putative DNA-binding domain
MSRHAAFLDAFQAALAGDDLALAPWGVDDEAVSRGLSVYRNTVATGLIEAILDAYPTVVVMMGRDWTAAAARQFTRAHPPNGAGLIDYGAAFPGWLAGFAPAADYPYLPMTARADRCWLEAHLAADAVPLTAHDFSLAAADQIALHPSVRLLWSADNGPSLWRLNRPPAVMEEPSTYAAAPEGLLLVRTGAVVETRILARPPYELLRKLRAGRPFLDACEEALTTIAAETLTAFLAELMTLGAFIRTSSLAQPSWSSL